MNNAIYGLFQQSRANNSKVTVLIRSGFEVVWYIMPILVTCTCKFDKDLINNEHASDETSFSHYSIWEIFQCSRARNTEVNDPIRVEFELIWNFTPVLDTCQFGKVPIRLGKDGDTIFPIISQWQLFIALTTTILIHSAPKPNVAFTPPHGCYTQHLIKTGQLVLEKFMFERLSL